MLRVVGFSMWIGWIEQCISTVSFSVLVNGSRSRPIFPTCRICQGDPLSPYLFIWVAQAFSDGLEAFASNSICKGIAVTVSPHSPHISHLLFADDCFLFMEIDIEHAWCLMWLLDIYCKQAGQRVNFSKSELFGIPSLFVGHLVRS